MNGDGAFLRAAFASSLSKIECDDVAVFLSGGADSRAVLYGLLDCGKRVHAYTFAIKGRQSKDFVVAQKIAKDCGARFTPVILPDGLETLRRDIYKLHDEYRCEKKTEYQCVWPLLYLYPKVEERDIAAGYGSAFVFPLSQQLKMYYRRDTWEYKRELMKSRNVDERAQHAILCRKFQKRLHLPFAEKNVIRHFWSRTWDQLHKPHLKNAIRDAYETEFGRIPPHIEGYQIAAGIRDHFDKLLRTRMNAKGHKSIVGVLNDVNKGARIAHL